MSPSFTSKQNSCNCCLLRGGVFNWKAKQTFTTTKLGTCAFKGSSKFVKVSVTFLSVLSAPRKQNKQKHLLGWKQESEDDARSVYLVVYRLLLTVCTSWKWTSWKWTPCCQIDPFFLITVCLWVCLEYFQNKPHWNIMSELPDWSATVKTMDSENPDRGNIFEVSIS